MQKLKVLGRKLVNTNNEDVQLRGISSHGLSWYPQYVNYDTLKEFHDKWNINVFRLAMYTAEENGYCVGSKENKEKLLAIIEKGVHAATLLDMYVIIDWHILFDNNPLMNINEAKEFFKYVSERYQFLDNVIYEICNEPNGNTSWTEIKEYANEIIPIIRANAKNSIILVGTPHWSQDVDVVADNPLDYPNVMYSFHFYSSTHKQEMRDKVDKALFKGLPVFISEFGVSEASGAGVIDYDSANLWFDYLRNRNLSHIAWNLSNRDETCAILKPTCHHMSEFNLEDYTQGGLFLFKHFANY